MKAAPALIGATVLAGFLFWQANKKKTSNGDAPEVVSDGELHPDDGSTITYRILKWPDGLFTWRAVIDGEVIESERSFKTQEEADQNLLDSL